MKFRRIGLAALVFGVGLVADGALAQKKSEWQRARDDVRSSLDIDGLILQASYNVSTRYNLNESQHAASEGIFQKHINKFLVEHQDEIYPLIRDIVRQQGGADKLSPDQIKRIGRLAEPLIGKAYEAIMEANKEWVEKVDLSPDQKRLLEWDFKEMEHQFEDIRDNFRRMRDKGEFVQDPMFPQTEPSSEPPPLPKQPPVKEPTITKEPAVSAPYDPTAFDVVVDKFIKDYELDAAQIVTADSLRNEFKQRAVEYRKSNQKAYDDIARRKKEAQEKGDLEAQKKASREEDILNAEISKLIDEMTQRLLPIPRESQKQKYEEKFGKPVDSGRKTEDKAESKSESTKPAGDGKSQGGSEKSEPKEPQKP
jgi:hypothetical protein